MAQLRESTESIVPYDTTLDVSSSPLKFSSIAKQARGDLDEELMEEMSSCMTLILRLTAGGGISKMISGIGYEGPLLLVA